IEAEPSLYTVKAVLILDNDGERLYAKYYDGTYPSVKEQKAFEKNIFSKTHRTDSEIALLEGLTVVYKSNIDLFFYVIGSSQENELMLMAVLNCLFDSLSQMLRKNVERRSLLENMEGLFLAVDEIPWMDIDIWTCGFTLFSVLANDCNGDSDPTINSYIVPLALVVTVLD
uniref:Coatomer subunit zeta n=1 Tax=Salmo trutta TaxID=8032 RepID=A0A674ES63_SALTR